MAQIVLLSHETTHVKQGLLFTMLLMVEAKMKWSNVVEIHDERLPNYVQSLLPGEIFRKKYKLPAI